MSEVAGGGCMVFKGKEINILLIQYSYVESW